MRISDWSSDVCSSDLLLAPDLSYRVPLRVTRSTADQARSVDRVMMHFDDDHASIMGRIGRLGTRSAWAEDPPSRTRRLVTNVRVETTANDDEFARSEEHTSELQSLMRISYAVFCLKKKKNT